MNKFPQASANNEDVFDLGAYLVVLKNAKWRILTFAMVVTVFTVLVTFTLIPQFKATATLLIESEQTKAVSPTRTSRHRRRILQRHR